MDRNVLRLDVSLAMLHSSFVLSKQNVGVCCLERMDRVDLTSCYCKKTHKIIHDFARPREPLLTDPSINRGNSTHKYVIVIVITLTMAPDGTFDPFPGFKYTGDLRPVYPLSPRRHVPPEIPRPDYAENGTSGSSHRKPENHVSFLIVRYTHE